MVAKHVVITLVVGAAAIFFAWQEAPATWTRARVLGLFVAIAGFVFWTVARFQLGSSFAVTAQARHLVTRGLYGKIRNPIYFFGSLFIIGYILVMGHPWALLIFLAIIPLQLWRARKEAQALEAKFGDEYRTYRSTTWF